MRALALAAMSLCLSAATAEAAKPPRYEQPYQFDGDRYKFKTAQAVPEKAVKRKTLKPTYLYRGGKLPKAHKGRRPAPFTAPRPMAEPGEVSPLTAVVGGRPAGCPHRFCGCALSIKLFGKIIPTLNLAANWVRIFPRDHPAPGMVAARRGHVFKLLAHVRGNVWLVWDANSGRGRIRVHNRSIAGYVIVNPQRRA